MLEQGFVSAAAIAASVLFILSLGGLSNQEKAKRAVCTASWVWRSRCFSLRLAPVSAATGGLSR